MSTRYTLPQEYAFNLTAHKGHTQAHSILPMLYPAHGIVSISRKKKKNTIQNPLLLAKVKFMRTQIHLSPHPYPIVLKSIETVSFKRNRSSTLTTEELIKVLQPEFLKTQFLKISDNEGHRD